MTADGKYVLNQKVIIIIHKSISLKISNVCFSLDTTNKKTKYKLERDSDSIYNVERLLNNIHKGTIKKPL